MYKKFLLLLLSLFLISVCIFVYASEEEYVACLQFANQDWSVQEWGSTTSVPINGAGTYSLCFNGSAEGVSVLSVYLPGVASMMEAKNLTVSDVVLTVDGKEIPIQMSQIRCGDLEDNGDYWIELYHSGRDDSYTYSIVPDSVRFSNNLTVQFTLSVKAHWEEPSKPTQNTEGMDPTQDNVSQPEDIVIRESGDHTWVLPVMIGAGLAAVAGAVFLIVLRKRGT